MKLKIGSGTAATFAALDISEAVLTADYQGRSSLELTVGAGLSASALIAPFQRCELQTDDGTIRWVGWLDEAPRKGSSGRITYILQGPHRWLERANFAQSRAGLVILAGAAGASATTAPQAWNVSAVEILTQALTIYTGAFNYTGTGTFTHQTPPRFRADVDCLTALASLLSYAPEAVLWWTFPSGTPTLNIGTCSGAAAVTLNAATVDLAEADLNPRYDLLYDTVVVYYVRSGTVSGAETAGPGGEAQTLGASRTKLYTYDASVLNNYPSSGLAAVMASYHQRLWIDAKATKCALDWADVPGQVYGFAGTELAAFAGCTTVLHTITRDLMQEQTVLELGVMPGKQLYKVSDLDLGVTGAAGNPAFTPSPFTATEVTALKNLADGVAISDVAGLQTALDNLGAEDTALQDQIDDLETDKLDKPTSTETGGNAPAWLQVERCDGKKLKVLTQGGGWV